MANPKLSAISTDDPPVTVEEAKSYCRLFDDSHNTNLALMIDAAVELIESELRENLRPTRYRWSGTAGQWNRFPEWPVQEIHSISCDEADQDLDDYSVDDSVQPPLLVGTLTGSVVIEWTAGLAILPAARKLLVLAMVAEFRRNPEAASNGNQLSAPIQRLLQSQKSEYDAVR